MLSVASTLTSDDPRYRQLFDVAREAIEARGHVEGDLTPAMNALRDRAPVTGERHRRFRAVVQPRFPKPRAQSWRKPNWIDEAVDTLVERLDDGSDGADLNMELCARLPVHVVTRGMGMSGEDALIFREHLHRGTAGARHLPEAEANHAKAEVARMLKALIASRREAPADDVVSALVTTEMKTEDGGGRYLTDEEIFGYCRLIMLAGGGTTWRQLGITLHALLDDYRFWEACREDRALIEVGVEESARWMPTEPTFPRLTIKEVDVGGISLPKGARIDLCVGAANRDPARWEDSDRYDLFRKPRYHVRFGLGPHQCLEMNVARQEMTAAIGRLLDHFPNMRLNPDAPAPQL